MSGKRFGFEFKYADVPSVTKSLNVARDDLQSKPVLMVHPGGKPCPLNRWAEAVAIHDLRARLQNIASATCVEIRTFTVEPIQNLV